MYDSVVDNDAAGCIKPAAVVFGASSAAETRPEGSAAVFVWGRKGGGAPAWRSTSNIYSCVYLHLQNPAAGTLIGSARVMSAIDKRAQFN